MTSKERWLDRKRREGMQRKELSTRHVSQLIWSMLSRLLREAFGDAVIFLSDFSSLQTWFVQETQGETFF